MKNRSNRISIVGGSGSGKSRLARELAEKLDLPVLHLDTKYYQENWSVGDIDEFKDCLLDTIYQDQWIIDGNFVDYFPEERFDRSDLIIFIDTNRFVNLKSMYKRYKKYQNKEREDLPKGCHDSIDKEYLKDILVNFNKHERKKILFEIGSYQGRLQIFKSRKKMYKWIDKNL